MWQKKSLPLLHQNIVNTLQQKTRKNYRINLFIVSVYFTALLIDKKNVFLGEILGETVFVGSVLFP